MTEDFEFKKFSIPSNNFLLLIFSDTYPLQFYLDELGVCGIYHSFIWSTYRLVSFTLLWLEIWKNIVCGHRIYSDKFRFKIHILFQKSHFLKFTFFKSHIFLNSHFSGTVSILTLAVLSMQRYLTIVKSDHFKVTSFTSAFLIIAGIWIYTMFIALPPFFGFGVYVPESSGLTCAPDWESNKHI